MDKIDDLGEDEFKDARAIIELLQENLNVWKEEEGIPGNNNFSNIVGGLNANPNDILAELAPRGG